MRRPYISQGAREIVDRLTDGWKLRGPVRIRRGGGMVTRPWAFERGGVVSQNSVVAAERAGLIRVESDGDHHVAVLT